MQTVAMNVAQKVRSERRPDAGQMKASVRVVPHAPSHRLDLLRAQRLNVCCRRVTFSSSGEPTIPGKSFRGARDMLTNSNPTEKSLHPTHEEVGLRAYQIYIERGCTDGHDVDDWLQAEHDLLAKYANVGRIAKSAGA